MIFLNVKIGGEMMTQFSGQIIAIENTTSPQTCSFLEGKSPKCRGNLGW